MLIYEKNNSLYGTWQNIPSDFDEQVVYKDENENIISLIPTDTYLDGGNGSIIRLSDGKIVNVYIDDVKVIPQNTFVPQKPELIKHSDYLYELNFDFVDYKFADTFFHNLEIPVSSENNSVAQCTSVWKDGVLYRAFDWNYNWDMAFKIHIEAKEDLSFVHGKRFASDGVSDSVPYLTKQLVESGNYSAGYKLIPFYCMDGKNENGLAISKNVVPRQHGNNLKIIPDIEERYNVQESAVVRFVLDNFESAKEAVEYIKNYVSIYPNSVLENMGYDIHYLIADIKNVYIAELIDNKFIYREITEDSAVKPIITNFHIFKDASGAFISFHNGHVYTNADVPDGNLPSSQGITSHGAGLERYNIIVDNYDDLTNFRDLVLYNKAYTEPWYSEFVGDYPKDLKLTVDSAPVEFETWLMPIIKQQYLNRSRDIGNTWHTTHNSIWDTVNNTLVVFDSSEDNKKHLFKLNQ